MTFKRSQLFRLQTINTAHLFVVCHFISSQNPLNILAQLKSTKRISAQVQGCDFFEVPFWKASFSSQVFWFPLVFFVCFFQVKKSRPLGFLPDNLLETRWWSSSDPRWWNTQLFWRREDFVGPMAPNIFHPLGTWPQVNFVEINPRGNKNMQKEASLNCKDERWLTLFWGVAKLRPGELKTTLVY